MRLPSGYTARPARMDDLDIAQLNVDSQNETGATDLYRRVGMTVWRGWPVFEKRVAAGVSSRP